MPPPNVVGSFGAADGMLRRGAVEDLRLPVLRFFAVFFAVRLREGAVLRALAFRDAPLRAAPLRDRAVRLVFRAALVLRPRLALRLRLPLLFFLPRGGILLLRELGSQSSGGQSKFAAR